MDKLNLTDNIKKKKGIVPLAQYFSLKINAEKTSFNIEEIKSLSPKELSGIKGDICSFCRERIENEIGESLFYLAGLCNAMGFSMKDIMKKEISNVEMLGKYSLK